MKWQPEDLLEELKRLLRPGVIGFYESFEVTEIIGFKKDGTATNFMSLFVAEAGSPPAGDSKIGCLTSKRIEIKGSDFKFGVFRFRIHTQRLLDVIQHFAQTGEWKTGPEPLKLGQLSAVVPQFVHANFNEPHPWNSVLKNNFYEGSHVLELFDRSKDAARFLLRDSRKLADLAQGVRSVVPMDIDGLSDRLGNIIVQLPVTVISTRAKGSVEGDQKVQVAWHPKASPRPLRISCEIYDDFTVDAFDSKSTLSHSTNTEVTTFRLRSPGGGARTIIWDDKNRVILGVTPVQTFVQQIGIIAHVVDGSSLGERKREFSLPDKNGDLQKESVVLNQKGDPHFVGSLPERPREPWRSERVFKLSTRQLQERKEVIQYGQFTGRGRDQALEDIRWLLERHGQSGAWLWDPFLSADDVLHTLFFCPHPEADLRAISGGKRPSLVDMLDKEEDEEQFDAEPSSSIAAQKANSSDRSAEWKNEQRDKLNAAGGNKAGLKLDFRMRRKGAGWPFHDRFLIFPKDDGRALAWSLGTSVNSLGKSHHILQMVSNGELVQNAFLSLWDELNREDCMVWAARA